MTRMESSPPSIVSKTKIESSPPSIVSKTKIETDWHSLYVVSGVAFVGCVQFSLFFASLWPYLKLLDPLATESFFGVVIAVYSLGQVIAAPLFGWWSNRCRTTKWPLLAGLICMLLGNVMYLSIALFPYNRRYVMLFARFLTGAGAGNVSTIKAYGAMASVPKDRGRAIAVVTTGIALGGTFGPGFQLLFIPFGYPGWQIVQNLNINTYTAPAVFACLINVLGMLLLNIMFKEHYVGVLVKDKKKSVCHMDQLPQFDVLAVAVCNLCSFTIMFVFTNIETLGAAFCMVMFGWSAVETVLYLSISRAIYAFVSLLTYLGYIVFKLSDKLNFRLSCVICTAVMLSFHLITFSWPFLPGHVRIHNGTSSIIASGNGTEIEEAIGCDSSLFSWCTALRPINVWLFFITYTFTLGIAMPTVNIAMNSLHSRILGPRRQGTMQGLLQVSGSIARMIGPLTVSLLFTISGPQMVWLLEIAVVSLSLCAWLICYKRMIPLKALDEIPNGFSLRTKWGYLVRF